MEGEEKGFSFWRSELMGNDIDLCVFNMQEDGNIAKACDGQKIGTTISGGK